MNNERSIFHGTPVTEFEVINNNVVVPRVQIDTLGLI